MEWIKQVFSDPKGTPDDARIAAFIPGASPPDVKTAILLTFLADIFLNWSLMYWFTIANQYSINEIELQI